MSPRLSSRPWQFRLLALLGALLALIWARSAAAEPPTEPTMMAPRDVAVLVQPSAVKLGPLPADFQRIEAGWLVLEFPGSVREQVEAAAKDAQDFRERLSSDLGQPVLTQVLVRVARDPQQMSELAPEGAPPFAYAAGMAYPTLHLILLSLLAPGTWEAPDLAEVLRHELTHLALDEAVEDRHIPRWFNEGFAIHESGELELKRLRVLWDATVSHRLLPLADLDRAFPADGSEVSVAYAESADVVRFLMRDDDRVRFGSLVQRVRAGTPFERALADAYSTDLRKLEFEWREEASHRFGLVPMLTGGGAVWTLIAGLAAVAWLKRRRRARAKLAQWAREEAEADAAIAAAREGAGSGASPADDDEVPPHGRPGVPVVEHDGRYYTLH
jgi:hypothetical protein